MNGLIKYHVFVIASAPTRASQAYNGNNQHHCHCEGTEAIQVLNAAGSPSFARDDGKPHSDALVIESVVKQSIFWLWRGVDCRALLAMTVFEHIQCLRRLVFAFAIFASSIAFAHSPQRIVSLAPVATEFLFALGLEEKIVGVTTFCDRPKEAKRIKKIGGFADPQLETIVALKPDLVIATPFGQTKGVVAVLEKRGTRVLSQTVDTLFEIRSFLKALGQATQRQAEAKKVQLNFDSQFASLKDRLLQPNDAKLKVLLLVSSAPIIGAGPRTFMSEVLTHLGASNIVQISPSNWPVLSLETLIKNPPDVIVVTEGEKGLASARTHLQPLIQRFPQMRWFAPKDALLQRPGLYLPEEAQLLLHGLKAHNG